MQATSQMPWWLHKHKITNKDENTLCGTNTKMDIALILSITVYCENVTAMIAYLAQGRRSYSIDMYLLQ